MYLFFFLFIFSFSAKAQHSLGATGLLNIPSADMQADGTFMMGGNYLPTSLTPDSWDYNTGNYFFNITLLPFIEITYRNTLIDLKNSSEENDAWNQDRSVTLRLRLLKEKKWWPSLVIGSNDILTSKELNMFEDVSANRFFSMIYAVATKHWQFSGHDLGFTLGGNIPIYASGSQNIVFAGVQYRPAFCKQASLMVEYDTKAFNFGASIKLFNHLTAHLFCYDGKAISGGLRYEIKLYTL